jgi:hypothetical protein
VDIWKKCGRAKAGFGPARRTANDKLGARTLGIVATSGEELLPGTLPSESVPFSVSLRGFHTEQEGGSRGTPSSGSPDRQGCHPGRNDQQAH